MVLRIAFFFMMAIGLVGFGTVAWISTRPPPVKHAAAAVKPTTVAVLAAAKAVHAGLLLKPEDIGSKTVPINSPAAASSMRDAPEARSALVGSMVRRSLGVGDILHDNDVMRPGDHGFLAAVLSPGMRAVTIGVDNTTGTAGLIWPGDRVDLIPHPVDSGHQPAAGAPSRGGDGAVQRPRHRHRSADYSRCCAYRQRRPAAHGHFGSDGAGGAAYLGGDPARTSVAIRALRRWVAGGGAGVRRAQDHVGGSTCRPRLVLPRRRPRGTTSSASFRARAM